MATITHSQYNGQAGSNTVTVLWETMGNDDTGTAVQIAPWADRTISAQGTFGSATVTLQGSEDNSTWRTLDDNTGTAITFTADGSKVIAQNPRYIRVTTAGGTGTDLDVYITGVKG